MANEECAKCKATVPGGSTVFGCCRKCIAEIIAENERLRGALVAAWPIIEHTRIRGSQAAFRSVVNWRIDHLETMHAALGVRKGNEMSDDV